MIEIIVISLIGFVGAFLIKTTLVWLVLSNWIRKECKAEGPDYIRRHYKGQLVFMFCMTMGFLLLLVVLDIAWFSKQGVMVNVVRKLPFLADWGDIGVLAWPLWASSFVGLVLGGLAGTAAGVYGFPKRNPKCRRVLPIIYN